MSIRALTVYIVSCDWSDCRRTTMDLNLDDNAHPSESEALADWVNHDAVDATNGKQYCDKHATSVCVECGVTDGLTEGKDRWFRCPTHHAKDGS